MSEIEDLYSIAVVDGEYVVKFHTLSPRKDFYIQIYKLVKVEEYIRKFDRLDKEHEYEIWNQSDRRNQRGRFSLYIYDKTKNSNFECDICRERKNSNKRHIELTHNVVDDYVDEYIFTCERCIHALIDIIKDIWKNHQEKVVEGAF